nr:immunoglobulin light chain junction region [Macaca mulatta]MOW52739.1 immunoglobulin light chain junction region [Macaca mulatta]MOW53399.1 immunoglobulin light chain junction region [Macaca mulatta]MOW53579.1 immunoglobulin light chain junction region [Macaca mulatta]MOW54959.1 immunoglobulin light chain junction region [Macaca mulatta]
CLQGYSFPLTF